LWPTVLDRVKRQRKVTWMLLFEKVTVSSVDESGIVLAFPDAGSLSGFTSGGHSHALEAALLDTLGVALQVHAVLDPSRAPTGGSTPRPPQRAEPPVDDVPLADGPPAGRADDADDSESATNLLVRELGATVVERVEADQAG
jgi:DNA polymerase-3 subunit gamma/tau